MKDLTHLYQQAAIQDQLLQSYRSIQLISQIVFLGIGVFLFGQVIQTAVNESYLLILSMLIVLFLLAMFCMYKVYGTIKSRYLDVDYWQGQILAHEENLQESEQVLTKFKVYQKQRSNTLAREAGTNLLEKGKGHTRKILDVQVPIAILSTWIVLCSLSVGKGFFFYWLP